MKYFFFTSPVSGESSSDIPVSPPGLWVKDVFDRVAAFICLVLLLPALVVIALVIRFFSHGPAFYRQRRVGRNGVPFKVLKFRTMIVDAEHVGLGMKLADQDSRITKEGKFLRQWSLDELPQLVNVVKGEMSFIGPRPTLQYQVDNYSEHQRLRLLMKPGITGWAQVNGRNAIPWEDRIELDVWYVDNWSLLLDAKIFLRTLRVVAKREDVYSGVGMSHDFTGNEPSPQKVGEHTREGT